MEGPFEVRLEAMETGNTQEKTHTSQVKAYTSYMKTNSPGGDAHQPGEGIKLF